MAIIPLPERGQPLDLTYIYQIANAINNISTQVYSSSYKYVTIDTPDTGKQSLNSSDTRTIAATQNVANNTTVTATTEVSFSFQIDPPLKHPPVATATLQNFGGTSAGKDATILLTSVERNVVSGIVKFNSNGDASVNVHAVIIGIPS
jgi:hypothetical protein